MRKLTNRLKKTLNTSGASLAIVLAAVFFLMAISASALAAANANAGTGVHRRGAAQLSLYNESLIKMITYGLQTGGSDEYTESKVYLNNAATLGGQILRKICLEVISQDDYRINVLNDIYSTNVPYDDIFPDGLAFSLAASLDADGPDMADADITIEVTVTGARAGVIREWITYDDDEFWMPPDLDKRTVTNVAAEAVFVITTETSHGTIITVLTFGLSGAELYNRDERHNNIEIVDAGTWRLVSYEKLNK